MPIVFSWWILMIKIYFSCQKTNSANLLRKSISAFLIHVVYPFCGIVKARQVGRARSGVRRMSPLGTTYVSTTWSNTTLTPWWQMPPGTSSGVLDVLSLMPSSQTVGIYPNASNPTLLQVYCGFIVGYTKLKVLKLQLAFLFPFHCQAPTLKTP